MPWDMLAATICDKCVSKGRYQHIRQVRRGLYLLTGYLSKRKFHQKVKEVEELAENNKRYEVCLSNYTEHITQLPKPQNAWDMPGSLQYGKAVSMAQYLLTN